MFYSDDKKYNISLGSKRKSLLCYDPSWDKIKRIIFFALEFRTSPQAELDFRIDSTLDFGRSPEASWNGMQKFRRDEGRF